MSFEHDMSRDLVPCLRLILFLSRRSAEHPRRPRFPDPTYCPWVSEDECGVKCRKCYIQECCLCKCFATYITHKLKSEKSEHFNLSSKKFENLKRLPSARLG